MGEAEIVIVGYVDKGPVLVEENWRGVMTPGGSLQINLVGKNNRKGRRTTFSTSSPDIPASHRNKVGGGVHNIKISLPYLVTSPSRVDRFSARLDGSDGVFESVVVNNINLQAEKALDNDFGAIVARTAIRAIIRAVATDKIQNTDTGNLGLNVLKNVSTMVANEVLEHADTRMCFMLPQRIIVTRIPVQPGTHSVKLDVRDKNGGVIGSKSFDNIEVKRGEKKVFFNKYL